jgi:uncharacterized protein (DUF433 family)
MRIGMNVPDWLQWITIDPTVCHGKPCIRGRRIMVSIILDYVLAGKSVEAILEQYLTLKERYSRCIGLCSVAGARRRTIAAAHGSDDVKKASWGSATQGRGLAVVDEVRVWMRSPKSPK